MTNRFINKKIALKLMVIIYLVSSTVILTIIGERSYRSTLIKYGYELGTKEITTYITDQHTKNPCDFIEINYEQKTVNLIDINCIDKK